MDNSKANEIIVAAAVTVFAAIGVTVLVSTAQEFRRQNLRIKAAKNEFEASKLVREAANRADQMIIDDVFTRIQKKNGF